MIDPLHAQPGRTPLFHATLLILMLACIGLSGCAGPGFVGYVIAGPPKVKAKYTLKPAATLVIVDDPKQLLGDPNFPAVVGANVGYHLTQNDVLTTEQLIPQDHLSTLAAQLDDRYPATPIDQIGARLDAQQVIHVLVRSTDLEADNTYYRPVATVEVKVIDTATGERLFPKPADQPANRATAPGYTLDIEMKSRTLDTTRRAALTMLARELSERIGLEVAQVFYTHVPPDAEPTVNKP